MSKKANPTIIGIFIVGALALTVTAIVVFGAGSLFSERIQYVLYFEGSLKGLGIGAPVIFKGIKVGEVTEISVIIDRDDLSFMIPVFIEIDPSSFKPADLLERKRIFTLSERWKFVDLLVKRGLRAQLQMQSLVTGKLLIAIDFYPDMPAKLYGSDSTIKELPTIPSSMEALTKKIEELPLDDLVSGALRAIEGIDRLVNNPEIGKNLSALHKTQEELQRLMQNINKQVGPISTDLRKTSDAVTDAAKQAADTLETINGMVAEDSKLRYELNNALKELSAAARSMRAMTDTIQQNPESLIYGRGGAGGK
jgi:paraquat-inducible protein B